MSRRLLLSVVALLCTTACPKNVPAPPPTGPSVVRLPRSASVFVRSTFDSDASTLIGAFLPDDLPDDQLDEANAARTRCSDFIKVKRIPASGRSQEVFGASQGFGGSLGVPNIAKVKGEKADTSALLIDYEVMEKLQAEPDTKGLQECCTAYPDQCTRRYIASAIRGKGFIYAATSRSTDVGVEAEGTFKSIPFGASAFYKDGLKWERTTNFDGQFFAFGLGRYISGPAPMARCSWVDRPPRDLDGVYFIGVSDPMETERLARDLAMRNAREQVVNYLGEWLTQQAQTTQSTTGNAAQLATALNDQTTLERMSQGLAQFVENREFCPQEERTTTGTRVVVKVLSFFPNAQRATAARASVTNLMNMLQEKGQLTPERKASLDTVLAGIK